MFILILNSPTFTSHSEQKKLYVMVCGPISAPLDTVTQYPPPRLPTRPLHL